MSNQIPVQTRSIYRAILRELPPRPLSNPSPLQSRIRGYLSTAPKSQSGGADQQHVAQAQLDEANQFAQYVKAQRIYATLLERYNPGANMDEEERVRLTARRVGMDLPPEVKGE